MPFQIKSKDILGQTLDILCRRHWDTYLNESVVGGNHNLASQARKALDIYAYAASDVSTGNKKAA